MAASVALSNGTMALTDGEGRFTFQRVPPGSYELVATLGDVERAFTADIESAVAFIIEDEACRERPGAPGTGVVEGDVCNRHTGNLVTDAAVAISLPDGTAMTTQTDDGGHFRMLDVPVGSHVLTIDGEGYTRAFGIDVVEGGTTIVRDADECGDNEFVEGLEPPPENDDDGEAPPVDDTDDTEAPPVDDTGDMDDDLPGCVPEQEIAGNGIDEDCDGVDAECNPIEVTVELSGDCVETACPPEAPYPVGCDIEMDGGDERGCIANTPGESAVYFQEGDACGAGHLEGTLLCSALLCVDGAGSEGERVELNEDNCAINKDVRFYPDDRDGCPETD